MYGGGGGVRERSRRGLRDRNYDCFGEKWTRGFEQMSGGDFGETQAGSSGEGTGRIERNRKGSFGETRAGGFLEEACSMGESRAESFGFGTGGMR